MGDNSEIVLPLNLKKLSSFGLSVRYFCPYYFNEKFSLANKWGIEFKATTTMIDEGRNRHQFSKALKVV